MKTEPDMLKETRKSKCEIYLEDFYGKPLDELRRLKIEDEELLDWGPDVGEEVIRDED